MHKFERHEIINDLLLKKGSVIISKLSEQLHVTEETIRNDLKEIEDTQKIKRVRGGAYLIEPNDNEVPIDIREGMLKEEKTKIANNCMNYINPGDTIALDSSTTASTLAKLIKSSNLSITVITNSLIVSSILNEAENISLIVLGGALRRKSSSMVGYVTSDSVKKYSIDKAFISSSGLTMPNGLTDMNEAEAKIRQNIILASKKIFLLIDYTKFDFSTPFLISNFDKINYIVTDKEIDASWKEFLNEKNIKLLI